MSLQLGERAPLLGSENADELSLVLAKIPRIQKGWPLHLIEVVNRICFATV
jgi:hypothetical protein